MTIENPPRLWAFAVRGAIHAAPEEAPLLASVHQGWGASKPQAYVREDVAETETTALCRERDALLARVEALRSGVLDIRYAAYEVTLRGEGEHPAVVCARVLEADTAAAGKGVG